MYHRQIKELLDFVANINSVDKSGDFELVVKKLLDVLADGFKLDQLFFVHQMTPSGLPQYILKNLSEKKCAEYRDYYYKQDPFKILDGPPGEPRVRSWLMPRCNVMRLRELVEYSSFVASEYYNEFWRPQNIDNELGAFLVNDGRVLGYLGLYRKSGDGWLWEEEMQLLKLASPYITLTLENIILHHQREINDLATLLVEENSSVGLMVLDPGLKVLFQNRQAGEYCRTLGEDPFSASRENPPAFPSILHNCRKIMNQMKTGGVDIPGMMEKEIMDSPSGKFIIHTYYLNKKNHSLAHRDVFVIKIERMAADSVGQQLLMNPIFGFTHREEDIVGCLFDGLTNKEIAERLYISEITVKKHVQNICGKLGVNTRTAVISKILKTKRLF